MNSSSSSVTRALLSPLIDRQEHNKANTVTADNVAVLYRLGDADGLTIAQYYQSKRAIPAANVLSCDLAGWVPSGGHPKVYQLLNGLAPLRALMQSKTISAVVLCGYWPHEVIRSAIPAGAFTISTAGTGYNVGDRIDAVVNGVTRVGVGRVNATLHIDAVDPNITITARGSGYTTNPTLTFSAPDVPGGRTATAQCLIYTGGAQQGQIFLISLSDGGSGYTHPPTITISGGGGTGGAATCVLGQGQVTGAALTAPMLALDANPTFSVASPTGSGAAVTLTGNIGTSFNTAGTNPDYLIATLLSATDDEVAQTLNLWYDEVNNFFLQDLRVSSEAYYGAVTNPYAMHPCPDLWATPKQKAPMPHSGNCFVPVFRLEVADVSADDQTFGAGSTTHVNYVKRMIDDAIAAEAAHYTDMGSIILSGSSSYGGLGMSVKGLVELGAYSIPYQNLYTYEMSADTPYVTRSLAISLPSPAYAITDQLGNAGTLGYLYAQGNNLYVSLNYGTTDTVAPTYNTVKGSKTVDGTITFLCVGSIPANTFAAGCTGIQEGVGVTFVQNAYTNIFFHSVGTHAYYDIAAGRFRPPGLQDYTYRKGAIALIGQSFGATPSNIYSCDYHHRIAASALLDQAATNALNVQVVLHVTNTLGRQAGAIEVKCTGAATSATVAYSATTKAFTLVDSVNGTTVMPALTTQTIYDAIAFLRTNAPAGWSFGLTYNGISRAACAIKAGACVAIGANREPYAGSMVRSDHFLSSLWVGQALCEFVGKTTIWPGSSVIYGDPLYRPFWWRAP